MVSTTVELLDSISRHLGDASDYRIAKELGVDKATVSRWRVGKGTMSDGTALRVAELLGNNPAHVLVAIHADRTDSPEARKIWRKLAASLGSTAACLVGTAILLAHSDAAHAQTPAHAVTGNLDANFASTVYYGKSY